jgi:glycosyltransferase involved in cell wall biosynthesis
MMEQAREPASVGEQAEAHVPLLSVTVLNYNYAHYLPQCLDSILRQTFTDFELLLINDCSTDRSLEVIQPYLADPRVTLINHEQNQGYIASLIEGSDRSRGKYLTVISADDYCLSDRAFETLLRPMETDPEIVYAFSAYGMYGDDRKRLYLNCPYDQSWVHSGAQMYRDLLVRVEIVLHTGTMIRTSAYRAAGGYNPAARYSIDQVMWLMLCAQGAVAYSVDELYAYRRHGENMSESFDAIRRSLEDALYGVRASYVSMSAHHGVTARLYTTGIKHRLSCTIERAVFAGNHRGALYALWCSLQMHPLLTIFQSRTLIILARAILGQNGYELVRRLLRPHAASLLSATYVK